MKVNTLNTPELRNKRVLADACATFVCVTEETTSCMLYLGIQAVLSFNGTVQCIACEWLAAVYCAVQFCYTGSLSWTLQARIFITSLT
jgi:hypothetical protein